MIMCECGHWFNQHAWTGPDPDDGHYEPEGCKECDCRYPVKRDEEKERRAALRLMGWVFFLCGLALALCFFLGSRM